MLSFITSIALTNKKCKWGNIPKCVLAILSYFAYCNGGLAILVATTVATVISSTAYKHIRKTGTHNKAATIAHFLMIILCFLVLAHVARTEVVCNHKGTMTNTDKIKNAINFEFLQESGHILYFSLANVMITAANIVDYFNHEIGIPLILTAWTSITLLPRMCYKLLKTDIALDNILTILYIFINISMNPSAWKILVAIYAYKKIAGNVHAKSPIMCKLLSISMMASLTDLPSTIAYSWLIFCGHMNAPFAIDLPDETEPEEGKISNTMTHAFNLKRISPAKITSYETILVANDITKTSDFSALTLEEIVNLIETNIEGGAITVGNKSRLKNALQIIIKWRKEKGDTDGMRSQQHTPISHIHAPLCRYNT